MKKIINIFNSMIIAFALVVTISSCDDMLDLQPESNPSDAVMWTSPAVFEKEANNFYSWLPRFMNTGGTVGLMDREEMADTKMWALIVNQISNSTYGTIEEDEYYTEYFKRMRSINYLFKNAADYPNPDEIKQYVAEAHFFRAFYSYLVFIDFGPLTIVKEVLDATSPEVTAPRASRDEFANFIIEDLEEAINIGALPKQSAIANTNPQNGRISLGAAQALLARMCLFEGTWQKYHYQNTSRSNELLTKAANYADMVIADDSYALFRDVRMGVESYRYMFILESATKCNYWNVLKSANREYIFRNRFHENTRQSGQNVTLRADVQTHLTRKMVEMFLDRNGNVTTPDYITSLGSYKDNRDPRLSTTCISIGQLYWNYASGSTLTRDRADSLTMVYRAYNGTGFYCNKLAGLRPVDQYSDGFDVPIIRLAEVYLTYAEAKCELGGGNISDADLDKSINKLRDRVDMPHLTQATVPAGSTMLNEIRRERTVELFLEGFRYDDLRRWKTAETEMSQNLEGVWMGPGSAFDQTWQFVSTSLNKSYTYYPNENQAFPLSDDGYTIREAASGRQFQQKHYLRPLPTKQIELNPNLEQNPGWDN